ncbi:hypothetical protein GF327_07635 [Candidatus Woesearchaeota archaeon]|nr:hypothetical protein [Candidatus Woesearchaeota archaeon]
MKELIQWITECRERGFDDELIKKKLYDKGYSSDFVENLFDIDNREKEKRFNYFPILIFLLFFISIVILFGIINQQEVESDTSEVEEYLYSQFEEKWNQARCTTELDMSLINLVYIEKTKNNMTISCKFGLSYNSSNLIKLKPNELIFYGQLRECSPEVAKIIYDRMTSKNSSGYCNVPILNNKKFGNNFYFYLLECRNEKLTSETLDKYIWGDNCHENLESVVEDPFSIKTYKGLIDENLTKILIN